MPYRIIYANTAGRFVPARRHHEDIRRGDTIGIIRIGKPLVPVPQRAGFGGRIISVFTYEDNGNFVDVQFPLCLVWDRSPQDAMDSFDSIASPAETFVQPAFAMTAGDTERVKSGNGKKKAAPEKNSSTKVKRSGREKTASGRKASAEKETAAASKSSAKAKGSSKMKRASAKSKKNKKSVKVR